MQEYNITIFRQSRVILSVFFLPVVIIITIFIGAETHSFFVPVLFLIFSFVSIYYFIIGRLKITFKKDELSFEWKKKIMFNYRAIPSIKISDIKTIVLDEGKILKKIKTTNSTIYINNSKIKPEDSDKFISLLINMIVDKYNVKVIDSWDEFSEKGYLKIAYAINFGVIVISIITVLILAILGYNIRLFSLALLLLFIPQMLLYRKQMRRKMNK